MKKIFSASCIVKLNTSGNEIQIFPSGGFRATDGRPEGINEWYIDAESAQNLIDKVSSRKNKILIDYEHQSFHSATNGQPSPAAGWFYTLVWREGEGLFATDAEWTEKARQMIKGGEYRYISPAFHTDNQGVIIDLISIALTNTPALDGMREVSVLKNRNMIKKQMSLYKPVNDPVLSPDKPISLLQQKSQEIEQLKARIETLEKRESSKDIDEIIDNALVTGRIPPSGIEAARILCKANKAAFVEMIACFRPIEALTGMQSEKLNLSAVTANRVNYGLTDTELQVCKITGRKPEEFAKYKRTFEEKDHSRN